jgi:DNA-binding CsgD family transcriptional regulator
MPKAERTRAATRLRRPRGQRASAQLLERPSRKQQAERIEALAERGLGSEEIADRLGLARSTVNKYRRDPDGERERARRERYRGRCRGCGRRTRGSDGPDRAREWCRECAPLRRRRWSDAQMLEAIRDWTRLNRRAADALRLVAGARPGRPQRCFALPGRARQVAQREQRGEALWLATRRDGQVYLLRKGRDFEVEVESLAIAARRWARGTATG